MRNEVLNRSGRIVDRVRGRWYRRIAAPGWEREPSFEYDDLPLDLWWENSQLASLVRRESLAPEITDRRGAEVEAFFGIHLGGDTDRNALLWSIRRAHIEALPEKHHAIGVMQKVNNSRWINKYFRAVNIRLEVGGMFVGCAEVNGHRKKRVFQKLPIPLAHLYCWADFVVHRIWPKIPLLNRSYFAITRGYNRPLSEAEVLGRLVSCGFGIVDYRYLSGLMYFAVRKRCLADVVRKPTYGPVCTLQRVGKGGEMLTIYKLRTMHPYAEFLQEYLFSKHGTRDGDKILDDFRVATWAKILRRLWLDEAPMIFNLLKGDIKLVGVRPISRHKFSTYPRHLQNLRTRFKPGLIPPFYVDLPETVEAFFETEERYLHAYEHAPIRTDVKYFWLALWNILIRRARSG